MSTLNLHTATTLLAAGGGVANSVPDTTTLAIPTTAPVPLITPSHNESPIAAHIGSIFSGASITHPDLQGINPTTITHAVAIGVTIGIILWVFHIARRIRWRKRPHRKRDPRRVFTQQHITVAKQLAGNQCEQPRFLFFRCRNTGTLHADHHWPHSRGGHTTFTAGDQYPHLNPKTNNLVILCSSCNLSKTNHLPLLRHTLIIRIRRAIQQRRARRHAARRGNTQKRQ